MPGAYTFPPAPVLVEITGEFAFNVTGVFRPEEGADPVPVYDLNGSPIPYVTVGPKGAHQAFKADIPDGVLDFGSVHLIAVSKEALSAGIEAAEAAVQAKQAAQAAQAAAETAASAALNKADAQHGHVVGDITASGERGPDTFLRGDGTWAVPPSAVGGGGNVSSPNIPNILGITQSDYDALATKDNATLYVRIEG